MTIHYIYATAGYAFWFYIILYITCRMLLKVWKDKHHDKYIAKISKFFSGDNIKRDFISRYKICLISNDDQLFEYCCECYLKTAESCCEEHKEMLKKYLTEIVDYKIRKTTKHNRLTRCLIIGCIDKCSLGSSRIYKFLQSCRRGSEAQRQWLEHPKELNKSFIKEADRWNY